MPHEIRYRVENAQIVTQHIQTEHEGAPATLVIEKAVIECLPHDSAGRTLTLVLPLDAIKEFAEGADVVVSVSALEPEEV